MALAGPAGEPEVVAYAFSDGGYVETAVARGARPTTVAMPFDVMITASDLVGSIAR